MNENKLLALVTGASSGIGSSIAKRLAADNYHVLVHYNKNVDGANRTLASIVESGGSAAVIQFDINNSKDIDSRLDLYFEENDYQLSVLVNNAGRKDDALCGIMSDNAFNSTLSTNVSGTFYLLRWATKKMIRHRAGSIVNISSLSGQTGNAGQINYAASKAAIIAMTKTLATELGKRNIRVNAVAPGLIETEMIENIPFIEEIKKQIPLKRIGKPSEVSGVVSFLCSNDATYITGHTISVNGGLFPS